MRTPRVFVQAAAAALLLLVSLWHGAEAGSWSAPVTILSDTIAVGFMDSTSVVDMTTADELTIRCKGWAPSGAAEPYAVFRIRAIGSMSWPPDTNSTAIIPITPVADHSYVGSAAGDSVAYGAWTTGNAVQIGNGEILFRAARYNSKYPYPAAEFLGLDFKGQRTRVRYVYFQVFAVTAGGSNSPRFRMTATRWTR